MPRRVPLPDALRDQPFPVSQGLDAGVSRAVLDGPRFRAPHHGVRVPASVPDSLRTRVAALAQVLPAEHAFAGPTALGLRGLPELERSVGPSVGPLHVRVDRRTAQPRRRGVVVRSGLRPADVERVRGLQVLRPGALVLDVAGELARAGRPVDGLVGVVDAMLRAGASRAELTARIDQAAGRRGVRGARAALDLARSRVDSPMETRARLCIVRAGLPEPVTGFEVVEDGGWLGVVDLAYPDLRIAIEYDGAHHGRLRQWQHDLAKTAALTDHGWAVLRITARDLWPVPGRFLERLALLIEDRSG